MLSGFELYSRWVPLKIFNRNTCGQDQLSLPAKAKAKLKLMVTTNPSQAPKSNKLFLVLIFRCCSNQVGIYLDRSNIA